MNIAQFPLKQYQVQKVIGEGGMGTVYLAFHTQIQRKVAIKVLNPTYANRQDFRERFQHEAQVLATLKHPNIVSLYEYVQLPETLCLVMEYVEGVSLEEYISKISGPIPEAKALHIFKQIAEGLHFAHQQQIIHRDVKPANIMLTDDFQVKILDFGIAKAMGSTHARLTQVGLRLGTMLYMSPEQLRGQPSSFGSDMYALGVTLFEMLTGKSPYQVDISEYELIHKIVHEPLPEMQDFYPNISPYIQRILDKATEKSPEKRFASVKEFWEALENPQKFSSAPENHPAFKVEENVIEWIIKPEPKDSPKTFSPKTEEEENWIEEEVYLESFFGRVTNFYVEYFKGKDLFEIGRMEKVKWERIETIDLRTHREWFTGFVVVILSLFSFFWISGIFAWFFFLIGVLIAWISFSAYPTIVLQKTHSRKIMMRGWPWQLQAARIYVNKIQTIIKENYDFDDDF